MYGIVYEYRQISNISRTLVVNKIADHSDAVGENRLLLLFIILDLTPAFNGLGQGNYKTKRETFRLGDLVWLILEVWR